MSKYSRKKWGPKWLHYNYDDGTKWEWIAYTYEINPFRLFVLDLAKHTDGHRRITLGLGNLKGKSLLVKIIWRDVVAEDKYYCPRITESRRRR